MAAEKINSRKIQAEATKNKIYKTAIKLMEQKGFNNMKIDDICTKAGVSVGSFYNYFKSKDDILIEIYKRGDVYFEETVRPNVSGKSTVENIIDFFEYYARYNEITGVETTKQLFASANKLYISKGRNMQAVLIDTIKKGQESGEIIKDYGPEGITEYLFIAARGLCYDWASHDGSYNLREGMRKYMKLLVQIFAAK
ncbi:TetR/AcrR family transcriptional regulator [Sedimentibacter saalensis]|jgi:AcrR family transcriptional regulator|uniref:TetR family transcriptional regulator n=1 Tax=Sedimentibacter saalensis TaxID=130788 RepID=A0A562JKB6_9FIRM|nr:TetR/AcrR family transcriptional regulator [Sedimentibacter saalensis]MEA5095619.1 TetR/AcrR family transcriptional regulator [Sedimentibacter saalensis]TWH83558.1 TetR family transcriptional regulator [Sedimentibacter saalensis]